MRFRFFCSFTNGIHTKFPNGKTELFQHNPFLVRMTWVKKLLHSTNKNIERTAFRYKFRMEIYTCIASLKKSQFDRFCRKRYAAMTHCVRMLRACIRLKHAKHSYGVNGADGKKLRAKVGRRQCTWLSCDMCTIRPLTHCALHASPNTHTQTRPAPGERPLPTRQMFKRFQMRQRV